MFCVVRFLEIKGQHGWSVTVVVVVVVVVNVVNVVLCCVVLCCVALFGGSVWVLLTLMEKEITQIKAKKRR